MRGVKTRSLIVQRIILKFRLMLQPTRCNEAQTYLYDAINIFLNTDVVNHRETQYIRDKMLVALQDSLKVTYCSQFMQQLCIFGIYNIHLDIIQQISDEEMHGVANVAKQAIGHQLRPGHPQLL